MKKILLILILSISVISLSNEKKLNNKKVIKNAVNMNSGKLNYIEGIKNPEDLVHIPNTNWIISSGMAPNSGLHLVNIKNKKVEKIEYNTNTLDIYSDMKEPVSEELQAHGISIRDIGNKQYKLYVVAHHGKDEIHDLANAKGLESIEIFNINMKKEKPVFTWQGRVKLPEGLVGNAVVSDTKGGIYTTVALHPGNTAMDFFGNKPTGAIYYLKEGEKEFKKLNGTELIGNNGIEISKDGKSLYVVSMDGISKFEILDINGEKEVKLIKTQKINVGLGDNIHWYKDELIISASRLENCPNNKPDFSCMKGYHVSTINPETLKITTILKGENSDKFSGVSVVLPIGNTLWFGSFTGNVIAYRKFK